MCIICYKRCPYLSSHLTAIIAEIWKKNVIPPTWKKAITILVHKKGCAVNPDNFRPITLKTVTLKILTSVLGNKVMLRLIFRKVLLIEFQLHLNIQVLFFFTTHRTAGEGRGSFFIPLYHFHSITNIQTFIFNFA